MRDRRLRSVSGKAENTREASRLQRIGPLLGRENSSEWPQFKSLTESRNDPKT